VDDNGKFITPEIDDMYPFLDKVDLDHLRQQANLIHAIND
jgi:hypothetical protein